jgi:hypothetical protein
MIANEEVKEILNNIEKLPIEEQYIETEKYSLEEIESLINELYKISFSKYEYLLLDLLGARRHISDKDFKWTDENKKKLIKISDKFFEVFETAHKKAVSIASDIEEKIKNNDDFIKDYKISIKINPYINDEYYENNNIGYCLSEPESLDAPIFHSFRHSSYKDELERIPIYIDRSLNWNIEYFDDIFKDDYISYAIHDLLDHNCWSFNDIISIVRIHADIDVSYQTAAEITSA